jgi:hypothetical protein
VNNEKYVPIVVLTQLKRMDHDMENNFGNAWNVGNNSVKKDAQIHSGFSRPTPTENRPTNRSARSSARVSVGSNGRWI